MTTHSNSVQDEQRKALRKALRKKHGPMPAYIFTLLAELVGDVESGFVGADNVRESVIDLFDFENDRNFRPDKWHKHADVQAEFEYTDDED